MKEQKGDLPSTEVLLLDSREERIRELTRVLGGGEAAHSHAEKMLDEVYPERAGKDLFE